MRGKPVFFCGVFFLLLFLAAGLFLKDRFALHQINRMLARVMPDSVFYAQRFSLWPGSLTMENFGVKKKTKTRAPGLTFQGSKAAFRFSLFSLLRGDFSGLKKAQVVLNQLSHHELRLENVRLDFPENLGIQRMKYGKTELRDLSGRLAVFSDALILEDIAVSAFGGRFRGAGRLARAGARTSLDLAVHLERISAEDIAKALEIEKRMAISGLYDGHIHLVLEDFKLKDLSGRLDAAAGGRFLLKDESLKDQNVLDGKGLNIVVENLRDYHYDIGNIVVQKEGPDIKAEIFLQGKTGTRRLEIVWHGYEGKR